MARKDKRIVIIAQCLVNPYCRVHILGQNFPFSEELLNYLLRKKVGVIQYSCPETTAMGLMRNPQGRQQYDSIFFREHCKELLRVPMLMVREFMRNRYRLACYIGLRNSPTCGVHWGRHKVNRYQTESPVPVEAPAPDDPVLMGIMAEILSEELANEKVKVPFIEFPSNSLPGSEERAQFWAEVKAAVEPEAAGALGGS